MKKLLFFAFLFSISVVHAQTPEWRNENVEESGAALRVPHSLINISSARITKFQSQINSSPALKSALNTGETIYLPDTVIESSDVEVFDSTRYSFTYNPKGLLIRGKIEKSGTSSNGKWTNNELDSCTYDAKGHQLSVVIQTWLSEKWTNSSLDSFTYDANSHVLTETERTWTNGQWANPWRNTYTYYADGNKRTALYECWLNGQWTNSGQWSWTYDAQGNNLFYLYEQWANEQWVNSIQFTKTYDENGNNLTTLNKSWSNDNWLNTSLDSCFFDLNGNLLSEKIQGWTVDHWEDSFLENRTYNTNNKVLTDTCYTYENGLKKVSMENTYTYDKNGNCILNMNQGLYPVHWDFDRLAWCALKDTCIYDANGRLLDDLRSYLGEDGIYYPKRRYTYSYDSQGNIRSISYKGIRYEWHKYDKYIFVYAGNYPYLIIDYSYSVDSVNIRISYTNLNITGVPSKPGIISTNSFIQNYPNPFSSSTTIEYRIAEPGFVSLKIVDAAGTEVADLVNEQKSAGNYQIDWNANGLKNGVYFCKLKSGNNCEVRKMLKMY